LAPVTPPLQAVFETVAGAWVTVDLPWDAFVPVVRNRVNYKGQPLGVKARTGALVASSLGLVYSRFEFNRWMEGCWASMALLALCVRVTSAHDQSPCGQHNSQSHHPSPHLTPHNTPHHQQASQSPLQARRLLAAAVGAFGLPQLSARSGAGLLRRCRAQCQGPYAYLYYSLPYLPVTPTTYVYIHHCRWRQRRSGGRRSPSCS
jgi:hypothetical protein